jgi:hypothetical protein
MRRCESYLPEVHTTQDGTSPVSCHFRTTWRDQFIAQLEYPDTEGEISGGKSDTSCHERFHFQSLVAAVGLAADCTFADGGANAGTKLVSVRERLL